MGTYLYAIRKLKKPQRIAREDGAVLVVAHTLRVRRSLHVDAKEAA